MASCIRHIVFSKSTGINPFCLRSRVPFCSSGFLFASPGGL